MQQKNLASLGLVAMFFTAVCTTPAALARNARGEPSASSREATLLRRIDALTERIEQLESRVRALESKPARASRPGARLQEKAFTIPVGDSPVLGPKNARVTVVIFTDFQCPFCARVQPLLRQIVEDPELKSKVNVVFKHFPLSFHKDAKPAAKAAMAAREQGEERFWQMSEKLFEDQRNLTEERFSQWAAEIGLDVERFEMDLGRNDARYEQILRADMAMGEKNAKVRGTPSIFVNGWSLQTRSVEGVKALIKEKGLL